MTRLEKVFNQKETKNKVLVTYTVAGDPNLGSSKKILNKGAKDNYKKIYIFSFVSIFIIFSFFSRTHFFSFCRNFLPVLVQPVATFY